MTETTTLSHPELVKAYNAASGDAILIALDLVANGYKEEATALTKYGVLSEEVAQRYAAAHEANEEVLGRLENEVLPLTLELEKQVDELTEIKTRLQQRISTIKNAIKVLADPNRGSGPVLKNKLTELEYILEGA